MREKKLRGEDADNPVIFNGGMILTDDTGRELLPSSPRRRIRRCCCLCRPKMPKASPLPPIVPQRCYEYEERTVTVDEMQQGVKLPPAMRAATPCRTLPCRGGH